MDHLPETELKRMLDDASRRVTVGALYRHYKNTEYIVKGFAIREEDNQVLVIYEAQYGEYVTFGRPLDSWLEVVEGQGQRTPRFIRIEK